MYNTGIGDYRVAFLRWYLTKKIPIPVLYIENVATTKPTSKATRNFFEPQQVAILKNNGPTDEFVSNNYVKYVSIFWQLFVGSSTLEVAIIKKASRNNCQTFQIYTQIFVHYVHIFLAVIFRGLTGV